jgi:CRISPR-associated endonuclease/helicase Cas3
MMPHNLLAKSAVSGRELLTLEQHLKDTEVAVLAVFKDRILRNWCRFFKIQDPQQFLIHLRVAALFHDIGKANEEFDALIKGKKISQALRHEWISALIIYFPSMIQWLEPSKLDLDVITASVLCHHLQASPAEKGSVKPFGRSRTCVQEVKLYLEHPQIEAILMRVAQLVSLRGIPKLPSQLRITDKIWQSVYNRIRDAADDLNYEIRRNSQRRSLLLGVKSGLIVADSVASGVFRTQGSDTIDQWVMETLHREPITPEEIENKILQPRYQQIEKKTGKLFELKKFQQKATGLNSRLLLLSGCGTGKTIFAYKWQQGIVKHYAVGRVIFLYPTRGTATEGFKDYVSWCPETDGSLLTGTAPYELKAMFENPSESTEGKDFTTNERLYALGFWGKRFFSATVDQFLSFLSHSYSGLVLLPVLADSVVVIDEVHSFSPKMFESLLSFLEHFDIPVLCMTATLSTSRKKALTSDLEKKQLGLALAVFPTEEKQEMEELEKAENRPRYLISSCDQAIAETEAILAFKQGKRVLWVVNTIDRCRQKARELESILGDNTGIIVYHSRFTLKDRKDKHQQTVNAFQSQKQSVIAVTTQVCEMSLDLDADVLITEIAPISSMVQRFGRSNRHGLIEHSQIWIYEPPNVKPYNKEEITSAKDFICDVQGIVSQKQLAQQLENHSPRERIEASSYFVEAGYWATSESFRETDDYSTNAVLDTDIDKFLKLRENKDPDAEGYVLPIPQKIARSYAQNRPDDLPKYLAIADSKYYCQKYGYGT